MGFREFISDRWYRRQVEADFERFQNIKPPPNPSRRHVDKLVRRLLDERRAWDARKELSMMGAAAAPSLAAALGDPRYLSAEWPKPSQVPAPLDAVLELIVPHGGEHVLTAAMPLVGSPSAKVRKTVALHLASTGRTEAIPVLAKLLQDPDGYVRSYVRIGVQRAVSDGRAGETFRREAYDLLLAQCDQKWESAGNEAAEAVIALDPGRAAVDLGTARWLSDANPNLHRILSACNRAGILLPEDLTRPLLDRSLPLAAGQRCYPHQYVAAEALESLSLSAGDRALPLLEAALHHEQEEVREAAARGIAKLAGLDDPAGFVTDRAAEAGFDALTHPQRVVYCANLFDAEVCNGGVTQFFGNDSGDRAAETLDALRELGHPEAEALLASAIKLVGPLAREPDRDMRLAAFEGRYDALQAAFGPLESAYYATQGSLRQQVQLYAVRHAEHFRRPPPTSDPGPAAPGNA